MTRLGRGLLRALPAGHVLPAENWARRHRQICILLWAHVAVVPLYGLIQGEDPSHVAVEAGILALFALGASGPGFGRNTRAILATMGLMTSSALLTHFSGGLIEMHFHFFVMVVVVSLYQSWVPFLVALGYVVLHHGILGALEPSSVFNHPSALNNPWKWAAVHGFFILGQSAACLVAWRVNEDALQRERAARGELQQANVDLAEAQALSATGSWDWDIVSGAVAWSDELYKVAGVDPRDFVPTLEGFLGLVHPEDRLQVAAVIESTHARRAGMDFECRLVRPDGQVRVVHCLGQSVESEDGSSVKVLGTCQDITERKELEREVQHRALHDALTGLGNRALFLDRAGHALAVRERTSAPLTVLYLDLDDFKTVNDSLGHSSGDALLVEVAARLLRAARTSDTVARVGGDEFAILLEDTDIEGARQIAERIEEALEEPVTLGGKEFTVRASIGIAPAGNVPPSNEGKDGAAGLAASPDLLRDADIAMYVAKREGRGGHQVFSPDMLSSVIGRMELQGQLNIALEEGQFVLHYQPVIDLVTGRIQSVEALVRWDHPERGMIPPDEFIPLAEETGLIVPLGAWVTQEATLQAKALQHELGEPITVNVNLSPRQLSSDVVEMVWEALKAADLDPACLVLEITETCVMSQTDDVITKLGALRAMGVRVAIDDFGTGYSSLGYLRHLPIDILKIDRSFVSYVTDGPEQSALAQAIVKLARIFDLRTIAEGIETDEQAQVLQGFGCVSGQGFHFARPMPGDELAAALRERNPALELSP